MMGMVALPVSNIARRILMAYSSAIELSSHRGSHKELIWVAT